MAFHLSGSPGVSERLSALLALVRPLARVKASLFYQRTMLREGSGAFVAPERYFASACAKMALEMTGVGEGILACITAVRFHSDVNA